LPYDLYPVRRRRAKPAAPQIDWSSPFARGLWHCIAWPNGSSGVFDLANPGGARLACSAASSVSLLGPSAYSSGGTTTTIPDRGNIAAGDFTTHMLFRPRSWTGDFSVLAEKGTSSSENGREFGIFFDTSGNVNFTHVGHNTYFATISTGLTPGRIWSLTLTRTGTTLQYYVNGAPIGSTFSLNGAGTNAVSTGLSLSAATTGSPNGDIDWILFQLWRGRCLTAAQVATVAGDPFGVFRNPPQPMWWSTGGGSSSTGTLSVSLGGFTLSGTATHTGPASSTGTASNAIGSVTLTGAATFVSASASTGSLSATLGATTLTGSATFTAAASASGTLSQSLDSVTLIGAAGRPLVFLAIPSKVQRTHKPTFPTLRRDHPLAQGLAFLTVPTIPGSRNLVDGSRGTLTSEANGSWQAASLYEAAIESTSTTLGGAYWPFPQQLEGASDFTIAWLGRIDSSAVSGKLVALPYRQDTSWTSPFTAMGMFLPSQLGVEFTDTTATRIQSTTLGSITNGQTRLYAVTRRGTAVRSYRDGDVLATVTVGSAAAVKFDALGATVRPNVYVMQRNHQNTGEGVDGVCALAAVWNRALTDGEIEQLWVDPFAMVRPRSTYLVGSQSVPGSAGSLSVTTDAVTMTGAATFTGAGASSGTLSSTLGAVTLTGSATFTAAASASGSLSSTLASVTLTGSATASGPGVVSGTLTTTLAAFTLTGSATAGSVGGSVGTLSATLASVTLTGAATHTGPAGASGSLSVTLGSVTLVGQVGNPSGSEWRGGSLIAGAWAGGAIIVGTWEGGREV
jgi:hypothetical protein